MISILKGKCDLSIFSAILNQHIFRFLYQKKFLGVTLREKIGMYPCVYIYVYIYNIHKLRYEAAITLVVYLLATETGSRIYPPVLKHGSGKSPVY